MVIHFLDQHWKYGEENTEIKHETLNTRREFEKKSKKVTLTVGNEDPKAPFPVIEEVYEKE